MMGAIMTNGGAKDKSILDGNMIPRLTMIKAAMQRRNRYENAEALMKSEMERSNNIATMQNGIKTSAAATDNLTRLASRGPGLSSRMSPGNKKSHILFRTCIADLQK
jgi:hypothetical protein